MNSWIKKLKIECKYFWFKVKQNLNSWLEKIEVIPIFLFIDLKRNKKYVKKFFREKSKKIPAISQAKLVLRLIKGHENWNLKDISGAELVKWLDFLDIKSNIWEEEFRRSDIWFVIQQIKAFQKLGLWNGFQIGVVMPGLRL